MITPSLTESFALHLHGISADARESITTLRILSARDIAGTAHVVEAEHFMLYYHSLHLSRSELSVGNGAVARQVVPGDARAVLS